MRPAGRSRVVALALGGLVVLAGCGEVVPAADVRSPAAVAPATETPATETPKSTASNDRSAEAGQSAGLTLDQLRTRVLSAVRAESTVHTAAGNLNPPPT